jgi:hypothetical protein
MKRTHLCYVVIVGVIEEFADLQETGVFSILTATGQLKEGTTAEYTLTL